MEISDCGSSVLMFSKEGMFELLSLILQGEGLLLDSSKVGEETWD